MSLAVATRQSQPHRAPPVEVERILDGLIGNALRHGAAGGLIEVCAYRHGGDLTILVSDDGDGVNRASLPKLFRLEKHADQRALQTGAGGYGLYLAGEQAAELDGRLSYLASASRSTFKLVVPGDGCRCSIHSDKGEVAINVADAMRRADRVGERPLLSTSTNGPYDRFGWKAVRLLPGR